MKFFRLTKEAFKKNKDAAPEFNDEMFKNGKYVLFQKGRTIKSAFFVSKQDKYAGVTEIDEFDVKSIPETAEEVSEEYFLKRVR